MSVQTLYTAATGMTALQTQLDVIANNLANMETTAFKAGRANFEDLLYQHLKYPGEQDSAGQYTPTGIHIGMGSRVESVQNDFTRARCSRRATSWTSPFKGGLLPSAGSQRHHVLHPRRQLFQKHQRQPRVGDSNIGRLLQPTITIPKDAQAIVIGPEGMVSVRQSQQPARLSGGPDRIGHFINPEGLLNLGENLYAETDASGRRLEQPGQNGMGPRSKTCSSRPTSIRSRS